jgi:hypothetical protein
MRAGPVPIGAGPDLRHDAVPMHTWASERSVSAEVAERIREIAQPSEPWGCGSRRGRESSGRSREPLRSGRFRAG